MKYIISLILLFVLLIGCNSDDNDAPQVTVTSFSGTVLYAETMEPVTNGVLVISGTDSEPLRSPQFRGFARLIIEDGTFEVSFEETEEIDRYGIIIEIIQGDFIVNGFTLGNGLQCLPGNCDNFLPNQDYELTILVPCDPNDCVQFPPQ